jgi:hypothetical protein
VTPNGEGTQENAADHQPDGGLPEHRGEALDPLVGLVQTGHDLLGAVENTFGLTRSTFPCARACY